MAFNHDNFIASQNYRDLDASLQWYGTDLASKIKTLEALARVNPAKAKALYQRDPVMKKIHRISDLLDQFKNVARAEG